MLKKISFLLIIVAIVFTLALAHRTVSYRVVINKSSQISELKLNNVLDRGKEYEKGQKYVVEHTFWFGELYKREINKEE